MFNAPFSFYGRIRRTEYGLSYIVYLIVYVVISALMQVSESFSFLGLLFIPLIWFRLAQGAKRCHDRGNSAWYQIIPFYGFWMLFAESDFGENEYGPNPKDIEDTNDEAEKEIIY